MSKLLYIEGSPRGKESFSIRASDAFIEAYRRGHPDDEMVSLNLFEADLPAFDGAALEAKYAILHEKPKSKEQKEAWGKVEGLISDFTISDKYVFAVPMWNFSVPYRFKQYLDIIVQPGYTFSYSEESGYTGLVKGKRAVVFYARGGEYLAGAEAEKLDFQKPYVELILGFIGFEEIHSIVIEPTLQGGAETASRRLSEAKEKAKKLAEHF